jgi:Flp pilus assembly protein TadG
MAFFSLFTGIATQVKSWIRSRDGNVGMIFAIAAIPLIIAAGMGIDMARVYAMRVRLGAALDAAALAVGSSNPASFTTAQLQQRMTNYFNANYPSAALGTPTAPIMTYAAGGNNIINFTATATIPTTFMRLIHVNSLTATVSNQVTRGITGLEVALVLDNTGSMMCGDNASNCGQNVPPSHMDTLRTDAQNIVDTLFAASTDPTKLFISVVPYVTAVNIGPAMGSQLNAYVPSTGGVYYDTQLPQPKPILDANGANIVYDPSQSPTSQEWIGCVVEATTPGEDNSGIGPDISEPPSVGWTPGNTSFTPYYWQNASGAPPYGSDEGWLTSGSTTYYNTWNVPTSVTNNKVTTVTQHPKAQYIEVDNGDYSNDSNSAILNSYGPNLGCPTPLVRLSNNQATLDAAVKAQKSRANSGTAIGVGMVWGWRTLSPNAPFADAKHYNTPGWIKAVVLETDGDAQVLDYPDYTGYGYIRDGKLGATTAGNTAPNTQPGTANYNLQNRLTTLCTNMKNAGIIIYTIGLGDGATNSQLKACAGPSPGSFYGAPTAVSLTSAFQQIANSLNQLRLSK